MLNHLTDLVALEFAAGVFFTIGMNELVRRIELNQRIQSFAASSSRTCLEAES